MRLCRVILGWLGCVLGEVDITGFSGKDLGEEVGIGTRNSDLYPFGF